jgi:RNA polymerase sigma-70 factor, ECF subfamily
MDADPVLIARVVRSDDRVAFGELVSRHQGVVRGFLRRMQGGSGTLASDIADDLAQETFLKAYRSLRNFRADSNFIVWLCAIAANELRNEWRRRKRRDELDAIYLEEPGEVRATEVATIGGDLSAAIASLSDAQRAALSLCYEQGLSHEEAAAALQWPVGTLKSHVSRGKARLRQLLCLEESDG